MTELEMRKGGGGKLSRSETVTVRLDPKLRYLAELAARLHRRTLSSYIEWAIKESLDAEPLRPVGFTAEEASGFTIGTQAENLWDIDEPDRFAKLALRYPHLLTHEEQVKWKLICENGYVWRGNYRTGEWEWSAVEGKLLVERLRAFWPAFCAVAESGSGHDQLPKWSKTQTILLPKPAPSSPHASGSGTGFDDMDDDIPF